VPWTNDSGGGQPKGPWGQSPRRTPGEKPPAGGMRPPDFNTILKKFYTDLQRYLPAGFLGKRGAWAVGTLVVVIWLALGFYTVNPQEEGVVLRFGAFVEHTGPGTHYHLPWPFESAYTANLEKRNQVDIGFKPAADAGGQPEGKVDESYMLTADENIVDMRFSVYWTIKDANAYLFNVDRGKSDDLVKAVAESAMREVIGQEKFEFINSRRDQIQTRVQRGMQAVLDSYNAGIEIAGVKMQTVGAPSQVKSADNDVQAALADQDKKRQEAEIYRNKVVPEASGEAARIIEDAEAYKQQSALLADGEAQRFNAIYQEYKKAPEVTRRRIYLETMTQVLGPLNKIIVDDAGKNITVQLPSGTPVVAPKSAGSPPPRPAETPKPGANK
jgi:modulator of FtsH protease HflK